MKAEVTFYDEGSSKVTIESLRVGDCFRRPYPTVKDHPALYIVTSNGEYVSVRSGAVCRFTAGTEVILVEAKVRFRDLPVQRGCCD